jgi:hypothetical protein
MDTHSGENQNRILIEGPDQPEGRAESCSKDAVSLRRWLVSFASGPGWYPVGEFVALDARDAIDRAIEVFGPASDYRAQEIPWDAAPLAKPNWPAPRSS